MGLQDPQRDSTAVAEQKPEPRTACNAAMSSFAKRRKWPQAGFTVETLKQVLLGRLLVQRSSCHFQPLVVGIAKVKHSLPANWSKSPKVAPRSSAQHIFEQEFMTWRFTSILLEALKLLQELDAVYLQADDISIATAAQLQIRQLVKPCSKESLDCLTE